MMPCVACVCPQVEIISELPADAVISCYRCGPMVDLCHGPHVPNTGLLKAVGVNSMSRAFWRADVNREPLQVWCADTAVARWSRDATHVLGWRKGALVAAQPGGPPPPLPRLKSKRAKFAATRGSLTCTLACSRVLCCAVM